MIDQQLTRIENKVDAVEEKVDYVVEEQHEMKITLVAQHATLVEHTRRSTTLEDMFKIMQEKQEKDKKELDAKVEPLIKDKYMISGALKFVGIMIGLAGVGDVILRCLHR